MMSDFSGSMKLKGKLTKKAKSALQQRMLVVNSKLHIDKQKGLVLKQARSRNKEDALAVDLSLQHSTGMGGYVFFQRKYPVLPRQRGWIRYMVDTEDLPAHIQEHCRGHPMRSCLKRTDESGKRFEVCWSFVNSSLFQALDMGNASFPIAACLYDSSRGKLGGFFDCDPPHKRHRHSLNAVTTSKLHWAMPPVTRFPEMIFLHENCCLCPKKVTKE